MKIPDKISWCSWPDTIQEPDGYDMKSVPDVTRKNLEILAEKYNELIDYIELLRNSTHYHSEGEK